MFSFAITPTTERLAILLTKLKSMFSLAITPTTERLATLLTTFGRQEPDMFCHLWAYVKSVGRDNTLAVVAATGNNISVHTLG